MTDFQSRLIEGLQILGKYSSGNDISAEHDVIYAGPQDLALISKADKARLDELGWHVDGYSDSYAIFV